MPDGLFDRFAPVPPPEDDAKEPLRLRLGWFLALSAAGLIAVAAAAYLLRALLFL